MSRFYNLSENEHLPAPLKAGKSAIIKHGEKIRKDVNLRHGFDIKDLVNLNNGSIEMQGAMSDGDRALEFRADGRFTIYLSSLRSGLSNNAIAAREFAHVALHTRDFKRDHPGMTMVMPKVVREEDEDLLRCKWEATWFAQGFLMPKNEFLDLVEERGMEEAASYFAVTRSAAEARYKYIQDVESIPDTTPEPA
jgi:hypothetical protein